MNTELATTQPQQLAHQSAPPVNPETLIMAAIDKGMPVETLERLLLMRDKLVAEQARNAFFRDLAAFQLDCPVIIKDKEVMNKDNRSVRYRYAPLDSIVRQIAGSLAAHGFSYQFTTSAADKSVSVTCHARHREGHTESTTFESQIDPQAFMNLAQKFGSALTFGKRYAFLAAFGIMTGDEDDDGQSTTEGSKAKTAREKMAEINAAKRAAEEAERPEEPLVHQSGDEDGPAEESPEMGVLTALLIIIGDATTCEELTAAVKQQRELKAKAPKAAAQQAIRDRATTLGFTWDRAIDEFVKKGGPQA